MMHQLSRRSVLIAGASAVGGLLVGCGPRQAKTAQQGAAARTPGHVDLNAWVSIALDGQVTVAVHRAEMGQGVLTALPMLLIEELGARWEDVQVEQAVAPQTLTNQAALRQVLPFLPDDDGSVVRMARRVMQRQSYDLNLQSTGGSSSVRTAWQPLRLAGATARSMLVQVAAQRWAVDASACRVEAGQVIHPTTGARLGFGALASDAAKLAPPPLVRFKDPATYQLIGQPVLRKDLAAKVDGSAVFGIDVHVPDMLYAALLQPPVFGAKVVFFDAAAALQRRGVHKVLQIPDGVVVVADRWWRAQQALAHVTVQFAATSNDAVSSSDLARQSQGELDHGTGQCLVNHGEVAQVLKQSAKVVAAHYAVPYLAHAAMEPINCTARVQGGRVEVWASTQAPSKAQWHAAQVAGVDTDQVSLHLPLLGGGFGRRLEVDMVEQAVAIALQLQGRAVKLLWTREQDTQHDRYRPAVRSEFSAALDGHGRVTAWSQRVADPSARLDAKTRWLPWLAALDHRQVETKGAFNVPYDIDHQSVWQVRPPAHVPVGPWRSVGHSYHAFFTESFIDELAHASGQDPWAYRRSLLGTRPRHRDVLDLAATQSGWGQALPPGRARGIALHESFGSICAQVAEVSLAGSTVTVHRVVCALDCGVVVNPDTVQAQLQGAIVFGLSAALFGEITLKNGRVEQSNFDNYKVVQMAQMPVIETHLVPSSQPPGGVGEPGTPPIAPALANALFALTGQRCRSLPIRVGHA